MAKKKIEKLSATLNKVLSSRGLGARLKEFRVLGRWAGIVGPVIARHAQPVSVRGKKLTVVVDSSAWMQELSLRKPEIIEKVNQGLGKGSVESVTLRLGEVAQAGAPPQERPPSGSLTAEERERIEQCVREVEDAGIRDAIRNVMEKDVLSRKRVRE
jgi:hypothetical protein